MHPPTNFEVSTEQLLTSEQLQHRLQICERTLDNLVKRSGLPHVRIGRARRFDYQAVLRHLQARNGPTSPEPRKRGRPRHLGILARARGNADADFS
jgi:excisionase family DNA binding protein